MQQKNAILTDPARELAELCSTLQAQSNERGETFLSAKFGVEAWSIEFFQIVFTIAERCALLKKIVSDLPMDDDFKAEIISHIAHIMDAFSAHSMRAAWQGHGNERVGPVNVGPLKGISASVRQHVAYRKLSKDELSELDEDMGQLLEWLHAHQLLEQDFIRQALIDGVQLFRFRLSKLQWLGWGYTLDSLREVIAAYMLLERGGVDPESNPQAAAMLQKVGSAIKSVYSKVSATKEATETADWLLKAYGAGSLVYQTGKPLIAGLIGVG